MVFWQIVPYPHTHFRWCFHRYLAAGADHIHNADSGDLGLTVVCLFLSPSVSSSRIRQALGRNGTLRPTTICALVSSYLPVLHRSTALQPLVSIIRLQVALWQLIRELVQTINSIATKAEFITKACDSNAESDCQCLNFFSLFFIRQNIHRFLNS